ncbi:hypothetical protein MnBA_04840 [Marinobacterium sp. BA1]
MPAGQDKNPAAEGADQFPLSVATGERDTGLRGSQNPGLQIVWGADLPAVQRAHN